MKNKDVIKNPERGTTPEQVKYVPAYSTLGITPIEMGRVSSSEVTIAENTIPSRRAVFVNSGNSEDLLWSQHSDEKEELEDDKKTEINFSGINENSYVLVVYGEIKSVGNQDYINSIIDKIFYGEHPDFDSNISKKDIMVFKRIEVKYGALLKE